MATQPIMDKSISATPAVDRLQLAEELLDLAERAQTHAHATGSVIALQRGENLVIRTSAGIAPEVGTPVPLGEGTIGLCARLGKPFNVSEEDKVDGVMKPLGVRSMIAVPIHHAGIFYGALVVLGQAPEAFTRMHVAIMMTMGNEVARVLKRMEAVAAEVAPGTPLRPAPATVVTPTVVPISRPTPPATAQQNIVETLKNIEQKPAPPVKLTIDASLAPKPTPPAEPRPASPNPAQQVAVMSFLELETPKEPPPLPELLCPGDDPRKYGTLKTAKSLEPRPTFTVAAAYRPTSSSHRKAPAIAVAAVLIVLTGIAIWHHKTPAVAAASATAAAAEPVVTPAPPKALLPVSTPATASVAAPEPVKAGAPAVTKTEVIASRTEAAKKPVEAKQEEEQPRPVQQAALRVAAAPAKYVEAVAPVEAPSLTLASSTAMPELPAPKAPAASLAVRKSTAVPASLVRSVAPIYPDLARRNGTYGDVKMQVTISATGKVSNIHVISGTAILQQAASNAVSQWQYRPATLDGRPVESTVDVVVKFGQK